MTKESRNESESRIISSKASSDKTPLITGVADIFFKKSHKRYGEIKNEKDSIAIKIKDLEIQKLLLEKELLDLDIEERNLTEAIVEYTTLASASSKN